jgi:uncharacterized membrane protein (DUF106 family)
VALGTTVAFLPVIFSDSLASGADALGSEWLELTGTLTPVFGVLVLAAATGLLITFFQSEGF